MASSITCTNISVRYIDDNYCLCRAPQAAPDVPVRLAGDSLAAGLDPPAAPAPGGAPRAAGTAIEPGGGSRRERPAARTAHRGQGLRRREHQRPGVRRDGVSLAFCPMSFNPRGVRGASARPPGGDRLPLGASVRDLGVPQGAGCPARGVRRAPGAHPGGPQRRGGVEPHVSDLRGGQRRPRVLRVRAEDAGARSLRDDEGGAAAAEPGGDELACYVVEVCPSCRWNHLARTFLLTPANPPGLAHEQLGTLRLIAAAAAAVVVGGGRRTAPSPCSPCSLAVVLGYPVGVAAAALALWSRRAPVGHALAGRHQRGPGRARRRRAWSGPRGRSGLGLALPPPPSCWPCPAAPLVGALAVGAIGGARSWPAPPAATAWPTAARGDPAPHPAGRRARPPAPATGAGAARARGSPSPRGAGAGVSGAARAPEPRLAAAPALVPAGPARRRLRLRASATCWPRCRCPRPTRRSRRRSSTTPAGNKLAELSGGENRVSVGLDQVSPHLVDAVLAGEDRDFFEHPGVDAGAVAPRHRGRPAGPAAPGRLDAHAAVREEHLRRRRALARPEAEGGDPRRQARAEAGRRRRSSSAT